MKSHVTITSKLCVLVAGLMLAFPLATRAETTVIEMDLPPLGSQEASGYIVEAKSVKAAARAVKAVGGQVTSELGPMKAVGATLLPAQVELLKLRRDVTRVVEDSA